MTAAAFRSDREEIQALRARVQELEDVVAAYQANEHQDDRDDLYLLQLDRLKRRLGAEPRTARLLIAMAKAPGRAFAEHRILIEMGSSEDIAPNNVKVGIYHARQRLAGTPHADGIATIRGYGYRMDEDTAAFINAIIAPPRKEA